MTATTMPLHHVNGRGDTAGLIYNEVLRGIKALAILNLMIVPG